MVARWEYLFQQFFGASLYGLVIYEYAFVYHPNVVTHIKSL